VGRTGRVAAFDVNCTPPQHVDALLEAARRATDLPLIVYPNHGRSWNESTYTWSGVGVDRFPAPIPKRPAANSPQPPHPNRLDLEDAAPLANLRPRRHLYPVPAACVCPP